VERVVGVEEVFSPRRNRVLFTGFFCCGQQAIFVKNNKRYCSDREKLAVPRHQEQCVKQHQRKDTELCVLLQDVHATYHCYAIDAVIEG